MCEPCAESLLRESALSAGPSLTKRVSSESEEARETDRIWPTRTAFAGAPLGLDPWRAKSHGQVTDLGALGEQFGSERVADGFNTGPSAECAVLIPFQPQ